jgi:hypothetical protein
VEFGHESRLSNSEPHILAKLALSYPAAVGRYIWFDNPSEGVCMPQTIVI